jgi:hypothetical protein
VTLRDGRYAGQFTSPEAKELSHWCRQVIGARVIAIGSPCRWSPDGRPRPCERQLLLRLNAAGRAPYQNLEPSHPLLTALPITGPGCFETFPHAITWNTWDLRGGHATAANQLAQGSELLEQAGIDLASLTSIDRIDAALCSVAVFRSCVA